MLGGKRSEDREREVGVSNWKGNISLEGEGSDDCPRSFHSCDERIYGPGVLIDGPECVSLEGFRGHHGREPP